MKQMYKIGDIVKIKLLELYGYITAMRIQKDNYVSYEVSYFSNGDYFQLYFDEFEIEKILKKDNEND